MTGVEQVFAVFISGDLLTKAVDKVKSDGLYEYKKGSSRSSSQNDSASEEEKPVKRAKLMKTERKREIESLNCINRRQHKKPTITVKQSKIPDQFHPVCRNFRTDQKAIQRKEWLL